jgi:multidrug efflux system outer membrane protein
MHRLRPVLACAAFAVLGFGIGCSVGPNYKRPAVAAPAIYRGQTAEEPADPHGSPDQNATNAAVSLGDQKWSTLFDDPILQQLIRTALANNYDVRVAAARILEAQAQFKITRANQYPQVSAGVSILQEQEPKDSSLFPAYQINEGALVLNASWNVDFWGRYRRATESARAQLLQQQWAKRAVLTTVVSQVAADYFQLRELDYQLELTNSTIAARKDYADIEQKLVDGGAASNVDLYEAQQSLFTATAQLPQIEQAIAQEEDAISVLLGQNPGPIPRGKPLVEQPNPPSVPAGLPSTLLERRPDIQEAEANVRSYNAQIGEAIAQQFPTLTLTGQGGYGSNAANALFNGSSLLWTLGAQAAQPIFNAGQLRNQVRLAKAQTQEAVLTYQKTVVTAFQNVSDELIAYNKAHDYREQQALLAKSAQDATDLAHIRYNAGATTYLEVLTNDTTAFSAKLTLAQAELQERTALVQLYNALGGGWQD